MKYKIRYLKDKETEVMSGKKLKASEMMLKDLLSVIPTLKKHGIEGEIKKKIKTLRSGRKSKVSILELSRSYQGKILKASAQVMTEPNKEGKMDRLTKMKELKEQIIQQIRDARHSARPPFEHVIVRNDVKAHKLGEVYLEPGTFVAILHKKIRADMNRGKKPTTSDNYVGVEIEMASLADRTKLCDALFAEGLGKYVCVKDDGSIGNNTKIREKFPFTHEVCVLAKQHEFMDIITRVCKVLNAMKSSVDKTCGLHVHVDMRNRNVEKSYTNLALTQHFLYAMIPANRRTGSYAKPNKTKKFSEAGGDRYHGINTTAYGKYQTLELRMHSGTTDAAKICNWISFILSIIDCPSLTYSPTSVDDLATLCNLTPGIRDYVMSRIAKFRTQHKTVDKDQGDQGLGKVEEFTGEVPVDTTFVEDSEAA